MMRKKWWLDLETGGLDKDKNGIIQIASIVEIDGEVVGRFDSYVRPPKGQIVTAEALNITQIPKDMILSAPDEVNVLKSLFDWLGGFIEKFDKTDKAIMAGYNVQFDDGFLRAACDRSGEKYLGSWKWPDLIDVRGKLAEMLQDERHTFPNFQLGTVAKRLIGESWEKDVASSIGIISTGAHDARVDIEATRIMDAMTRGKL
jgi:DNA polymerase III epsilon subunit-like protein